MTLGKLRRVWEILGECGGTVGDSQKNVEGYG